MRLISFLICIKLDMAHKHVDTFNLFALTYNEEEEILFKPSTLTLLRAIVMDSPLSYKF